MVAPSVALSADHMGAPNMWKNTVKNGRTVGRGPSKLYRL